MIRSETLPEFDASGKPHLLFVAIQDMTMPHMTGEELTVKFMRIKPGIPVMLCTGFTAKNR